MSKVQFILGRTGTGKTYQILNEIRNECHQNPTGAPIFIITPEQMTFHTEYQLLLMNEGNSMVRANALSFNRLAHRTMQEVGGLSRYHLDEVGKAMLLQKIMLDHVDELGIFKSYIKKPGFIKKMDELFSEFKSHQLETTALKEKLADKQLNAQTKQKVLMLASLYDEFNEATLQQYLTTEDYFTLLIETIERSQLIREAVFYIDGYHTFNPQELAIIEKLAHHGRSLTIVLTADLNGTDLLWQTTRQTYAHLTERLAKLNPITSDMLHQKKVGKEVAGLLHLERNFMQSGKMSEDATGLSFFLAPSRRQEIEEVAKRIHYLTHHHQVTFSNIAIYASHPQEDHHLYEAIFAKHGISYFLDDKESMLSHPVIQLLHKTFNIFMTHWKHDAVFEVLKTGLFLTGEFTKTSVYEKHVLQHLEDIDQLEHYTLARNIKKYHWISGETWSYGHPEMIKKTDQQIEMEEKLNQIKDQVATPLMAFEIALEQATTVVQLATAVFTFLEQLDIPMKLQLLAKSAMERGHQKEMKQHEQVWHQLLSILEQVVEVAGDDPIEWIDFAHLFKAGLEQFNFATVPATLDAVQIGDVTRSRYQLSTNFHELEQYGVHHVFIIGFNEGVLPRVPTASSLLSEKERHILASVDIQLAPSLIQSQQDDIFNLYTVMTGAQKSVTLSCVTENNQHPSYLLTHVVQMFPTAKMQVLLEETKRHEFHGDDVIDERFPGLKVRQLKADDSTCDISMIRHLFNDKTGQLQVEVVVENSPYERLTTPEAMFDQVLRSFKQDVDQKAYYAPILAYYQKEHPVQYELMNLALGYQNQVEKLSETLSEKVYTTDIDASVSRIELFNKCEFAHFMRYGLKLKEVALFELTVATIGNLYHEVLRYISNDMKKHRRAFASLTEAEIQTLSISHVEKIIEKHGAFHILKSSQRMEVMKGKLIAVVAKTLAALANQSQKSEFKESYFELKFKRQLDVEKDKGVTNWIETTPRQIGKASLSLKGVIDRIDIGESDGRTYVRVVDYKSSERQLELDAVYHGQNLQLLTYLDVALNWVGENARAGGALYFHLHRPYAKMNEELLTQDEESYRLLIEQDQIADYRMTGYVPENVEVVGMSDDDLMRGVTTRSNIVPVTLKKDKTFAKKGNRILKPEDFDVLRGHVNQKIEEAVSRMVTGQIAINPTIHEGKTPCEWCSYQAICQFDTKAQQHRKLEAMKPEAVLQKIKEGLIVEDSSSKWES
ncbi:MAG: PD-(D/E)XK nuclease family protein [Defluviitaleaceae bacterium]|nr:PD-(D/E)XK nuclease family protein [Defluviitaleaceae bacterium]